MRGLEIGSASGFSAATFYSQLYANNQENATMQCFDLSETCYYDDNHQTGDAVWEIHGKDANIHFKYGVTSADIQNVDQLEDGYDFLFIDANHRNPWAAFDLLSLSRFLKPNALIGIDDITMSYNSKFRDCNGARDIFRCWKGEKWRYKKSGNIGMLVYSDPNEMLSSVLSAISNDWEQKIDDQTLEKYLEIVAEIDTTQLTSFTEVIKNKKRLYRSFK